MLGIILEVCKARKATDYVRYCAVLTANAESDFKVGARQMMQDGKSYTEGVYQQSSKWYDGDLSDVAHTANMFLDRFLMTGFKGKYPVEDIWYVQQWAIVDENGVYQPTWTPASHAAAFWSSPETINYVNRLGAVQNLISLRTLK